MRWMLKALLLLLLVSVPAAALAERNEPGTPAAKVELIRLKLEKREVGRVEILHYPEDMLTAAALTPETLDRTCHYRLTVRDLRFSSYGKRLQELLKGTRVLPSAHRGDLRWGVVFYATDGARLGGLYLDASGRRGSVDDAAVTWDGELHRWLKASFGGVFR